MKFEQNTCASWAQISYIFEGRPFCCVREKKVFVSEGFRDSIVYFLFYFLIKFLLPFLTFRMTFILFNTYFFRSFILLLNRVRHILLAFLHSPLGNKCLKNVGRFHFTITYPITFLVQATGWNSLVWCGLDG